ncbi:hypothetical protein GGR56DRAFT_664882 [Xylariaceae sp. FL0804]|nr:hypothetical protein GGR56DRAFT_664882 [Xylariaceae sp. FL0804]
MAVDEEASFWPTENLVLKPGRKHFRTAVAPLHWQLRSLISAERQDIVYFPAGVNNTHITRLNTTTRECETIKVISFHPRCLVARAGWVCCGGENGEFAIIRDAGRNEASEDTLNAEFRATLNHFESSGAAESSSMTPSMSQLHHDMLSIVDRINGFTKLWSASNHKFGHERVNCVTIWQPPRYPSDEPAPGRYTRPVAVLANNDKTVTIVDLEDREAVDELCYPDCVNRGLLSPDGSLLVAICDDPYLYVHLRCPPAGKVGGAYKWVPLPRIRLKGQYVRDTSDCRGSFAACFSPSGRYLAVGTQYGIISIFDVPALADPNANPLITYFNSARAPNGNGAVRDMAFSPGPYDLLAWTEHRGRVGVADARTNFAQRQIISIQDHEGIKHYSLNDRSTIDPRLLDPRSERNAGSSTSLPSLLSQASSGRPLPNAESAETSRLNQSFTAEETAILEAVQSDRRRREARELREQHEQQLGRGGAALRPMWAERVSSPLDRAGLIQRARELEQRLAERVRRGNENLTDTQRETLNRILERERNRESREQQHRSTTTQTPPEQDRERRAPTPRRRSSIMQALTQNVDNFAQIMNRSQLGGSNNNNNESSSSSRNSPSPWLAGRLTTGWSDLEALYNLSGPETLRDRNAETSRAATNRIRRAIPVHSDPWNYSEDQNFHRAPWAHSRDHAQHSDDTAGLTWSEDGRVLYIGAEDGIYQFQINLQSRKIFPEITMR